ncbi:insulinase family protein [Persephonella atlantica]|uniref:Insulinase family protein n=1 Tax=Persephonella atlantica TaxID=2699429 RepID=A0ABS1GGX4_9AQUI|nr:pitrilysin family protein [Persephonella atlantica]MBK3332170.1 insulinase family protein [Persephonella atlantica]
MVNKSYLKLLSFQAVFFLLLFFHPSSGGESVIKNVLSNGVTVIFKETEGEGIIAGAVFIKGGSFEDPEGKKGLTNLTLSLLLKGSKNFSAYEINKVFEDSGGYISTSVGEEYSTIEFALRTEDFQKGMKVIKDMMFNPLFPEEKLEMEKRNVIAQIKAKREEGFSYAFDQLRKEMYRGTPYQYSPLGTEDDVNSITVKDVRKRWKELLKGGRFVVALVGDLSYKDAEVYIKKVFGALKRSDYRFPIYSYTITGKKCKTVKREGAQSTILVAYDAPEAGSKDYFSMKVLNGILGSGFTSRLFQELREKRGLAYAVGSFFPTRINMGRFIAYIGTAPEKTEESVKGIVKVVRSIEKGITDEELKTAKEKIIGHFLLEHQTRAKQAWYLGWFETIGLGYQMDSLYPEEINKVSKHDIYNVWKKYVPKGYRCVIVRP